MPIPNHDKFINTGALRRTNELRHDQYDHDQDIYSDEHSIEQPPPHKVIKNKYDGKFRYKDNQTMATMLLTNNQVTISTTIMNDGRF